MDQTSASDAVGTPTKTSVIDSPKAVLPPTSVRTPLPDADILVSIPTTKLANESLKLVVLPPAMNASPLLVEKPDLAENKKVQVPFLAGLEMIKSSFAVTSGLKTRKPSAVGWRPARPSSEAIFADVLKSQLEPKPCDRSHTTTTTITTTSATAATTTTATTTSAQAPAATVVVSPPLKDDSDNSQDTDVESEGTVSDVSAESEHDRSGQLDDNDESDSEYSGSGGKHHINGSSGGRGSGDGNDNLSDGENDAEDVDNPSLGPVLMGKVYRNGDDVRVGHFVKIYRRNNAVAGHGTVVAVNGEDPENLVDVVVAYPGFTSFGIKFGPSTEKVISLHPSFLNRGERAQWRQAILAGPERKRRAEGLSKEARNLLEARNDGGGNSSGDQGGADRKRARAKPLRFETAIHTKAAEPRTEAASAPPFMDLGPEACRKCAATALGKVSKKAHHPGCPRKPQAKGKSKQEPLFLTASDVKPPHKSRSKHQTAGGDQRVRNKAARSKLPVFLERCHETKRAIRREEAKKEVPFAKGAIFSKVFDDGVYTGTVVAYRPKDELYHVQYNDGDEEDLTVDELLNCENGITLDEGVERIITQHQASVVFRQTIIASPAATTTTGTTPTSVPRLPGRKRKLATTVVGGVVLDEQAGPLPPEFEEQRLRDNGGGSGILAADRSSKRNRKRDRERNRLLNQEVEQEGKAAGEPEAEETGVHAPCHLLANLRYFNKMEVYALDTVKIYNHHSQVAGYGTVKGVNAKLPSLVDVVVSAPGFVSEGVSFGPSGEAEIALHPSFLDPKIPRRALLKFRSQALRRQKERGVYPKDCLDFETRVLRHTTHVREDWTGLVMQNDRTTLAGNWKEMLLHLRVQSAEKAMATLEGLARSGGDGETTHRPLPPPPVQFAHKTTATDPVTIGSGGTAMTKKGNNLTNLNSAPPPPEYSLSKDPSSEGFTPEMFHRFYDQRLRFMESDTSLKKLEHELGAEVGKREFTSSELQLPLNRQAAAPRLSQSHSHSRLTTLPASATAPAAAFRYPTSSTPPPSTK
jgi:hypothetical protein